MRAIALLADKLSDGELFEALHTAVRVEREALARLESLVDVGEVRDLFRDLAGGREAHESAAEIPARRKARALGAEERALPTLAPVVDEPPAHKRAPKNRKAEKAGGEE